MRKEKTIYYDEIGNPVEYYLGWEMMWQGRSLMEIVLPDRVFSYTYTPDGIRNSKTVNGTKTEFLLNGTQILAQKTGSDVMWFFYDSTGARVGIQYGDVTAYYMYNLQGDVIGLADAATGKVIAKYLYDAWGQCISVENASGYTIGTSNPFRYRGYYYDNETGFYYLNSRYYDPEVGRFLNADAFASTDIYGALSTNMFAYCENNPVNIVDYDGHNPLAALAAGAAIPGAGTVILLAAAAVGTGVILAYTVDEVSDRIKEYVKTVKDVEPRDQSVYVLTKGEDDVRYVGRTNSPGRRAGEHKRDNRHPERQGYNMTIVFSGLTPREARIAEQLLISTYTLQHLDNARREIAEGKIYAFKDELGAVNELIGGFAEDELLNLGRRR